MLTRFKSLFSADLGSDPAGLSEDNLRLACAALLIEVAVIDQEFDDKEFETLQNILQTEYGVSAEECHALTTLAQQECEDATSLYQFTQLVNTSCSQEDKFSLVKGMWLIAYADGDLDKYEEYIIRKTSELLHVSHGDYIRAKHLARADKT